MMLRQSDRSSQIYQNAWQKYTKIKHILFGVLLFPKMNLWTFTQFLPPVSSTIIPLPVE